MMHFRQKSVGVDITDGTISVAVVEKRNNGIKTLFNRHYPMPDKAMENGKIVRPAAIVKIVRKALSGRRITPDNLTLSLVCGEMLVQTLDLPKIMPTNLSQFVRDEIKHYASLPSGEISIDYCGLKTAANSPRKAMVYAAEVEQIENLVRHFNKAGLIVDCVEPAQVALMRQAANAGIDSGVITLVLSARFGLMNFSVIVNNSADFVRAKQIDLSDECAADKIVLETEEILKAYELDIAGRLSRWQIIIDTPSEELGNRIAGLLDSAGRIIKTVNRHNGAGELKHDDAANPEALQVECAAVELAAGRFCDDASTMRINLIPAKYAGSRARTRRILIGVNAAAAGLLIMALVLVYFTWQSGKTAYHLGQKTKLMENRDIAGLIDERTKLNSQVNRMQVRSAGLSEALGSNPYISWLNVISDVIKAVPQNVQLVSLYTANDNEMFLEGRAMSHQSVPVFVSRLNDANSIESASIVVSRSQTALEGLVDYTIQCKLEIMETQGQ